jgi:hypothetical protein
MVVLVLLVLLVKRERSKVDERMDGKGSVDVPIDELGRNDNQPFLLLDDLQQALW